MQKQILSSLSNFYKLAASSTYASGKEKLESPSRSGFSEYDFREGDWYYLDSYIGFYQSWGQELIYYKHLPVWTCHYGGGLKPKYHNDFYTAEKIFDFLKLALQSKNSNQFQPRGPRFLHLKDYTYKAYWEGEIDQFQGDEEILYKGSPVFEHTFIGGLILPKE